MKQSTCAVIISALAIVGGAGTVPASGQTAALQPQEPREESLRIDVSTLGPQVGESVPDFTLADHENQTWTLASIMGQNGAMLVFVRSANW